MRFFGRSRISDAGPDHSTGAGILRDSLFAAYRQRSPELFELCRTRTAEIEAAFATWWAEGDKSTPERTNELVQVLGNIAGYFEEQLGRPGLMQVLTGPTGSNPIARWQAELTRAEGIVREDPGAAAAIGADVLRSLDAQVASGGLEEERARALYLIGANAFASGHIQEAREHLEDALALYRASGEVPALPLLLDLFDVQRYLGDGEAAARIADVLAAGFEEAAGHFYRRQSSILRAGEPLLRVIARIDDLRYELDDAAAETRAHRGGGPVSVSFEYRRNRPTIDRAGAALGRGADLASSGRLDDALVAFDEAASIDPFHPSPAYQMGVVFLEQRRWVEASRAFGIADELAPGWYHSRRLAWLARLIEGGEVPPEIAGVAIRCDDDSEPPPNRIRLLEPALTAAPDLGMLHLYAGKARATLGDERRAIDHFRAGLEARLDADVRCALLVELGMQVGASSPEGHAMLTEAADDEGNLLAAATAQLTLSQS